MMNLLRLLGGRTGSAPVARERLQILLAHERGLRGQPELLGLLRAEILAVVSRHVVLDPDKVIVRMDRGKNVSTLEVDIELPNVPGPALAAAGWGSGNPIDRGAGLTRGGGRPSLPLPGGCSCGAIRYEIGSFPLVLYTCNCT